MTDEVIPTVEAGGEETPVARLPRHKFWGAGEPDCPQYLKAPNGELHTPRCKVCGDGWRKSVDVCFADPAPAHMGAMRAALREIDPCSEEAYTDEQIARLVAASAAGVPTEIQQERKRCADVLRSMRTPDTFVGPQYDQFAWWVHLATRRILNGDERAASPAAPAGAPRLTDERIDRVLGDAYRKLVIDTGYNGGMGSESWDRAAARAIESEVRALLSAGAPASPAQSDVHLAAPRGDGFASPRSEPRETDRSGLPREPSNERIATLEREVEHLRQWYEPRFEILCAWARAHLTREQQETFFNIAANGRPHHTDEPEWFRDVIHKLASPALPSDDSVISDDEFCAMWEQARDGTPEGRCGHVQARQFGKLLFARLRITSHGPWPLGWAPCPTSRQVEQSYQAHVATTVNLLRQEARPNEKEPACGKQTIAGSQDQ